MLPAVHVIGTGGTIASTGDDAGAAPSLTADALVDAVPGIDSRASLSVEGIDRRPGFDMQPDTVLAVADAARDAAADGVDGVVVTHGTDTMEETAYALDLLLEGIPVIVTGAQRRPDEVSPDGPANLLAAVRAAGHPRIDDGVFVAFDDELHAARDVTKAHTSRLGTFTSPNAGPVGAITREAIRFHRDPTGEAGSIPGGTFDARVEVVPSGLGVDGAALDRAVADGIDGVVLDGTGLGNVTAALGTATRDAIDAGVPVVVASRCHAGATGAVYGTPGGGHTLRAAGAIHAGTLPAHKARILLTFALDESMNPAGIAAAFGETAP